MFYKIKKKLKQATCEHIFDYYKKENDYTSIGNEYRGIANAKFSMRCCKCEKEIIIWDMRKSENE